MLFKCWTDARVCRLGSTLRSRTTRSARLEASTSSSASSSQASSTGRSPRPCQSSSMSRRSTFTAISRRRRRIHGRSCTYVRPFCPVFISVRLTPSPRSVHVQHVGPSDNHRRVLRAGDAGRRRRAVQRTQHLPAAWTGDADAAHAAGAERLLPQVPGLRARPSVWDWCARK